MIWDIIHGPKAYGFIGFGDIHGPKPYKFIGFSSLHGPKPYNFIGFGSLQFPRSGDLPPRPCNRRLLRSKWPLPALKSNGKSGGGATHCFRWVLGR